jgi:hypothetical protein
VSRFAAADASVLSDHFSDSSSPAYEAAGCGLLSADWAVRIRRVKGVSRQLVRNCIAFGPWNLVHGEKLDSLRLLAWGQR